MVKRFNGIEVGGSKIVNSLLIDGVFKVNDVKEHGSLIVTYSELLMQSYRKCLSS
jgi:hypothetical protein